MKTHGLRSDPKDKIHQDRLSEIACYPKLIIEIHMSLQVRFNVF